MVDLNDSLNISELNLTTHKHLIYPPNYNPATDQFIQNPDGGFTFIHQITPSELMWHYWYLFAILFIIITYLGNKYLAPMIAPKVAEMIKGKLKGDKKDE